MRKEKIKEDLKKLTSLHFLAAILDQAQLFLNDIEEAAKDQKLMETINEDKEISKACQLLLMTHSKMFVSKKLAGHLWSQIEHPNVSSINQLCGLYYYTLSWNANHPQRREQSPLQRHHFPTLLKAFKMGSAPAATYTVMYFIGMVKEHIKNKNFSDEIDNKITTYLNSLQKLLYLHLLPGLLLVSQSYLFASAYFFKRKNALFFRDYAYNSLKYLYAADLLTPHSSKLILNFYGKNTLKEAFKISYRVCLDDDKPISSISEMIEKQRKNLPPCSLDFQQIKTEASHLVEGLSAAGLF